MLTLLSKAEFLKDFPSQELITLVSKNTKVNSVDYNGPTKLKLLPVLDNDGLLSYGAGFPVFISKEEFLKSIEYIAEKNIYMPFINFSSLWIFDEIEFAKILVKMIQSEKRYYIVTDNPRLKMIYKAIINFNSPIKKTLIIDLHNLFHVRFYAGKISYTKYKGVITVPDNLVKSFQSFLDWVLFKSDYDAVYFVTDSKENWRKKYPNQVLFNYFYGEKKEDAVFFSSKKNKDKEDELIAQIDICEDIIQKLGFPLIKVEGFEADDVIGSLSNKLSKLFPNATHYIYSNDKDLYQLLEYDNVKILDPKTHNIYDKNNDPALEKFGIPYHRMVEYLALVGDSSDGVPGVKGIGPKKALTLLNLLSSYSLKNIFDLAKINKEQLNNLDEKTKKIIDSFLNNLHQFILSFQVVFLHRNLLNDYEKIWFYFSVKDTINFLKEEDFENVFFPYFKED